MVNKDTSTTKDQGFASPDTASAKYRQTNEELDAKRQQFLDRIARQRSKRKLSSIERNPYREKRRRFDVQAD